MKKLFLILLLLIPNFAYASKGAGEAYAIIGIILITHAILAILLIICFNILPRAINYYKSFFIFSVLLYLLWGTWYLFYGFFEPIGNIVETIFPAPHSENHIIYESVELEIFRTVSSIVSLLIPIIGVLGIILFHKRVHDFMELHSKKVYKILYIVLPIIMLIINILILSIRGFIWKIY